ncbi:MAG: Protoporphyrinogen oxidase [Candidatus Acidoferrum typicum]|nr:Protoporphyrinogen oxidase [Candidatus Acidoferrum typicum]
MTPTLPILIVGGGISGLVCAYALRKAGIEAQLVEASTKPGGVIRSEIREGFLLDLGPQSISGTAALRSLCADLGIADQVEQAPSAAPRYVLIDGALKAVPLSPPAMLSSSFLSPRTKWRIARDALGTTRAPEEDESVAAFVRRKFGAELLERLVGPFVSGIYAGDPERLSLRAAFPQLYEAEQSAGSVIRGMRRAAKSRKGPRERPSLLSFRDGNETLVRALAAKIGPGLRVGAEVVGISVHREPAGATGFEIRISASGREETVLAERLIVATSADVAGTLLRDVNAAFEPVLAGIEYAPVAVVSLGYRREDVSHSLAGFGFLVPRSSSLQVLGTVWNSSLFPGRTPAGHVLLTSFVGGATNPGAAALSAQELSKLVHNEIAPLLQIRAAPMFSHVQTCRHALPQYNIGHMDRLRALERLRADLPALSFIGNYLRGPAIGNCVQLALATAEAIRSRAKST